MAHRVIWCLVTGEWPLQQIDHVDRNKLNNSWENLRDVSQAVNQSNTGLRSTNKSGIKGLNKVAKRGKVYWVARKIIDGKRVTLGIRKNKEEAAGLLRNAT